MICQIQNVAIPRDKIVGIAGNREIQVGLVFRVAWVRKDLGNSLNSSGAQFHLSKELDDRRVSETWETFADFGSLKDFADLQ